MTNSGTQAVVVDAARAGFALDLRGRPRVVGRRGAWLTVRPQRITLAPGAVAQLTVSAHPPARQEPGDHSELVLLTTRPAVSAGLAVRMRVGVVVVVRVPGRIVRRLVVLRVRLRPRRLELLVANRGNVTETVSRRCTVATIRRRGRVVARLRPAERQLLPHSAGLVELPFRRRLRGAVRATVALAPGPPCPATRTRSFALRVRA